MSKSNKFQYIAENKLPEVIEKQNNRGRFNNELHDMILDIIDLNSGGIKFTALIAELSGDEKYRVQFNKQTYHMSTNECIDLVEATIRNSNVLKLLDYSWRSMNRAKMFVYSSDEHNDIQVGVRGRTEHIAMLDDKMT